MKLLFDVFGMLLIGDGLLSALHPRRHCRMWEVGPEPCKQLVNEFVKHPEMARAAGALELLLGVWLATREEDWQ